MDFMAQIGKAARLLDLKGDVAGAVRVLEAVVQHPEIDGHIPEKVEALVFLADLHLEMNELAAAARYVALVEGLDLKNIEPDLVDPSLERIRQIKTAISQGSE